MEKATEMQLLLSKPMHEIDWGKVEKETPIDQRFIIKWVGTYWALFDYTGEKMLMCVTGDNNESCLQHLKESAFKKYDIVYLRTKPKQIKPTIWQKLKSKLSTWN